MSRKKKTETIIGSQETFFFIDSDGTEGCSNIRPYRHSMGFWYLDEPNNIVELPKGTIERLYNINMTFNDEPIVEQIDRN